MEVSNEMIVLTILLVAVVGIIYKENPVVVIGNTPMVEEEDEESDAGEGYDDFEMDEELPERPGADTTEEEVLDEYDAEQALMSMVTEVREGCDDCADSAACTPECQDIKPVCERLMGPGYYPNIQCPSGGSEGGLPIPYNIYGTVDL